MGRVTLAPNRRARRLTLSVRPSGEVRLSYPPHVGMERAITFLEERIEWVVRSRERMAARAALLPPKPTFTAEDIARMRREAQEELPPRVEALARAFGFRYGRITIRATRSKWGSCSVQGNLSLSLYLMMLPQHLRDFVLLHELCHTVHHNHSPRFHALLDSCLGGREKALVRELKSYPIR